MSESLGLGKLIDGPQYRDAIHIAVAPVVASESLRPGDDVGFTGSDNESVGSVVDGKSIGIVDPFLKVNRVKKGERFWLYLYPGSIQSLRHEWTHPAFSNKPEQSKADAVSSVRVGIEETAKRWIADFAASVGSDYDEIVSAAHAYLNHGDYLCRGGQFEGESVPAEFWIHFGNATGRIVSPSEQGSFFSCSC